MRGDDDSDDYVRAALEFLLSHPRQMSVVRELLRIRPTNDPCLGPWLHFVPHAHVRMQRTNENVQSCQCKLIFWLDFSFLLKETNSNSKFLSQFIRHIDESNPDTENKYYHQQDCV